MAAMAFAGWPIEAVEFYEGLEADNSKAYWQDHKATYETAVKGPLTALLDELEPEFGQAKVFRPDLAAALNYSTGERGGRPPFDPVLMFKVLVIRITKKKNFLKSIRTPLHDHARYKWGWSDTQVGYRFAIIQLLVSGTCIAVMLLK